MLKNYAAIVHCFDREKGVVTAMENGDVVVVVLLILKKGGLKILKIATVTVARERWKVGHLNSKR